MFDSTLETPFLSRLESIGTNNDVRADRIEPTDLESGLMLNLTGRGTAHTCDGITRRDFLQAGSLGAVGLTLADLAAMEEIGRASCRERV